MKKIVELIVNLEDIELEGTGVDAIALVENPAIELDFLAFKDEEFVEPRAGEDRDEFISRCIPVVIDEGYEEDQAAAICYSYWDNKQFDDLEDACWPGYEAVGLKPKGGRMVPNCVPIENSAEFTNYQFETYNDYPESAKNAAKRALEWRDSHPDQSCGTRVGWTRANQLASGKNISEETIARMASFARHLQYKDVPYSEGCGGLMVDAWGGQAGIEWAQRKLKEIREEFEQGLAPYTEPLKEKDREEMSEEQLWILSELEKMGTEYDPMETYVIDAQRASFSTLQDFLKGIAAIDILGKNKKKGEEGETVYRYAGPRAERGFCRAMLRLNKLYRRDELERLNSANPGFGRGGSSTYDVFEYKGGPNCRHFWEELTMFKNDQNQTVLISNGPVPRSVNQNAGKSNNMDSPSSLGNVGNNAYVERRNFAFNIDEDQRVVVGPAMIPHKMILRKDENGNPYYVYFTEKTIRDISEDYFEDYKHNNTNIEHDSAATNNKNTLLESWIVEDPERDKSAALGFSVPKGSWMVSYKINDDETWKQIKEGKLRGFSVEGYFVERADAMQKVEETYQEILDILDQVDV